MPRPRRSAVERAFPRPPAIEPTAVYTLKEAEQVLRIGRQTLRKEVRGGHLVVRVTASGRRIVVLGEELLRWFRKGSSAVVQEEPKS